MVTKDELFKLELRIAIEETSTLELREAYRAKCVELTKAQHWTGAGPHANQADIDRAMDAGIEEVKRIIFEQVCKSLTNPGITGS